MTEMHVYIITGDRFNANRVPALVLGLNTTSAFFFSFALCFAFPVLGAPPAPEQWMLGNPASSNCAANHNGSLFIQADSKTGGQYGICQLSPSLAVEEWCLYRNEQNIEKKDCPNLIKEGSK
jgi:putative hemolysin